MAVALPRRRSAPDTSRKASSRLSGSTIGVMEPNSAMTLRLTCAYCRWSGSITVACGARRRARDIGMAEWMPRARAS
jgi:hypothetical protein